MTGPVEREIKLRFGTAEAARRAVVEAGARPLRARRLQSDCLLDREREPLADRACTLRVRIDGGAARVTFKGAPKLGTTKVREELETAVGDGEMLLQVLERIGFRVWFRYEKYLSEELPARRHLVIAIDEAPSRNVRRARGQRARHPGHGRRPGPEAGTTSSRFVPGAVPRARAATGASALRHGVRRLKPVVEPRVAPRPKAPGRGRGARLNKA